MEGQVMGWLLDGVMRSDVSLQDTIERLQSRFEACKDDITDLGFVLEELERGVKLKSVRGKWYYCIEVVVLFDNTINILIDGKVVKECTDLVYALEQIKFVVNYIIEKRDE